MQRVTFKIQDETLETVDSEFDSDETNRSEYLRKIVASRHDASRFRREAHHLREEVERMQAEYERKLSDAREQGSDEQQERIAEQEERIGELEGENERLHRERRQILEQREEHDELVAVVEREQSLAERQAEAGVGTRLKWWMFGMKSDDD